MALRERLPQVELAVGESVTILVLRHLEPVDEADRARLRAFADRLERRLRRGGSNDGPGRPGGDE